VRIPHFEHLGTWAINLDKGSTNNTISDNEMNDLGGGGIKLDENCTDAICRNSPAKTRSLDEEKPRCWTMVLQAGHHEG
jgi:hypothetical protein